MKKLYENWESIQDMVERWNAEDDGFTYTINTKPVSLLAGEPVKFEVSISIEPIK